MKPRGRSPTPENNVVPISSSPSYPPPVLIIKETKSKPEEAVMVTVGGEQVLDVQEVCAAHGVQT